MRAVIVFSLFIVLQVNCEIPNIPSVSETTEKDVESNLKGNVTEIDKNDVSVRENDNSKDSASTVDRTKEHEKIVQSIVNSHFPKPQQTDASLNGQKQTFAELPPLVTAIKVHNNNDNNDNVTKNSNVHHVQDSIGTKILLYTQNNPANAEGIVPGDEATVKELSNFRSDKPLRVIIHGSFDGLDSGHWMTDMKDKFLQRDDENVILVDWSKGAGANLPDQRMTNVRMIGSKVSEVLKALIKHKNVKPEDIHVIAHSLGTFAADVIGRQIKSLGRISALDPGGPNFDILPIDMRLDSSDALFVDAIHTDVENTSLSLYGRGTAVAVGHMDFFPNGGSNQPGCNVQRFEDLIIRPIGEGVRRFVACHHYRAIDYFMETIVPTSSNCNMLAYKCDNYTNYVDGKCTSCDKLGIDCAEMGFRSIDYFKDDDKQPKRFYITTNRRKPYCLYHYSIEVMLSPKPEQVRGGVLFIKPMGEFGSMELRINGGMNGFRSGNATGAVFTHFLDIGATRSLTLGWIPAPSINLFSDPSLHVQQITVKPLNFADRHYRTTLSRTLCSSETTSIQPFYRRTFFASKGHCIATV